MAARILFVDDDKDDEEIIRDILTELNFSDFAFFNNGQAVIDHLETSINDLPALVVSDITLPLLDGLELARAIRNEIRYSGVDMFIYSGSVNPSAKVELRKIGVTEIVEKQSDLVEVKHTLTRFIKLATTTCK